MMKFIVSVMESIGHLLLDASIYMLIGLAIGGLIRVLLSPVQVARHLGKGRFLPVLKAAILGIPLPLCSCGVVPAAAALRKQGANRGATTAFLISTPESGVDSIAITYALIDPIMTLARPIAAFITAVCAGVTQTIVHRQEQLQLVAPDLTCTVDGCCDGVGCPENVHRHHHSLLDKAAAGLRYAFSSLWGDLARWYWIGMVLAGLITVLIPDDFMKAYLGGGLLSMLAMLLVGIPMYICATGSTVIAAALIMKGVSPGAALVLMLAGPATNVATLTLVTKVLGKRATAVYLISIAVFSVIAGLVVDGIYSFLGTSVSAVIGQASSIIPEPIRWVAAITLVALSIPPALHWLRSKLSSDTDASAHAACCCGSGDCDSKTSDLHNDVAELPSTTCCCEHKQHASHDHDRHATPRCVSCCEHSEKPEKHDNSLAGSSCCCKHAH